MGLFFKDDNETEVKNTKTSKAAKTPASLSTSQPASIGSTLNISSLPTPVGVSAAEKEEFVKFLNEVYQKGNFPGPDYQEFTDALKTMASVPMDERTKFTAIFAGFQVQGVNKARLVDTGLKYIDLIKGQSAGFNDEINTMLNTEVAEKQKRAQAYLDENQQIEQQMIALTEKKNKNVAQANQIMSDVNEQIATLNVKKNSFEAAAAEFIAEVQNNVEKIKLYLPEAVK
jgi:hypothetical protein